MKNVLTLFIRFFALIFGSFKWQLPGWLCWIGQKSVALGTFINAEHKSHKVRFYGGLGGFCGLVAAGFATYIWYINRPQPVRLAVNVSNIYPTALVKNAKADVFDVNFGGSAAKLQDVGKPVLQGIRINPTLKGNWKWSADNQLTFTVDGDWPVGRKYSVRLDKKLFPKHVYLETYEIKIITPKFNLNFYDASFYQDPKKAKIKKVIAEVHFSHPVSPKAFESKVKMKLYIGAGKGRKVKTKNIGFNVTYDEFFGKAYLHSDRLTIPNYESELKIEIAAGVRSKRPGKGSLQKTARGTQVPGMLTHFQYQSADLSLVRNNQYEPEQVLILNSTAAVNPIRLTSHLEVYALPRDRPPVPNDKKRRINFHWSTRSVTKKILASATKLKLKAIPTERENAEVISYKYNEKPGVFLYIRIKKGLESFGGYRLPEGKTFVARVPEYPKELKIMATGSLLSLSGEKKLSILARDLEYVRYRAQRLLPGQIVHFITQSSGELGKPSFDGYKFRLENISETFSEVRGLPVVGHGKTQYSHFDFSKLLNSIQKKPKGLFHFVAEGWNKLKNYQTGPSDRRFILITDLGIVAKKSVDGSYDLFVQSIASGRPIAQAQVQVLGKNGLPVLTETTDNDGHVKFLSLKNFKHEKSPIVFVVTSGEDLSFLPIHSHVNRLNYSRFDVGGVYTRNEGDRLEAYMFSDRGIYRPGEKIQVGYIVKHSDWSRDLSGVKLEMKITDPKGSLIRHTKDMDLNAIGFKTYDVTTGAAWPTGTYSLTLYIRKNQWRIVQIGSTSVKVEEFLPDRLKISALFSRPANLGWLNPKDLKGLVNLQNLFGTSAQDRKVVGELILAPSYPSFHSLKEWKFHDPMRSKKSFSEKLGETNTDQDGNAEFSFGLEKYQSASYLLKFMVEGFEADGGRSVLAANSVLISPLDYLIGFKTQGNFNYISKGTKIGVDFIAVNPALNQQSVENLKLKLIEFKQVSTLVKQSNGTYKYESVKKEYEIKKSAFKIQKKGTSVTIDTSRPGDFALVIQNLEKLELNRVHYSIAGSANLSFELEKNSGLKIKLNKSDFEPGGEIEISIRSPYSGTGLITIERERVFSYKWFHTENKSSIQKITIPSDLEGNGYVNVTFVRSIASNEIFMSPLSTGVAPFFINKSSRVNKIELKIPPLVRPGKELIMRVKALKPGKALVFVVNEGILQVAKYLNPDPLNSFYKKRALEVETLQILDLILPEFSKLALKRSSAAGGAASLLGKNLNPFKRKRDKSVAYWSGLIDIGPTESVLKYKVPDYFSGQLRVIAVAVSQEAMDATAEKTLVKGHFVLSPNTPTFVSPGDQLKISVGVSNNALGSGKKAEIKVQLTASNNIEVLGENELILKIDEGSESSAVFEILVKAPLGNANFKFSASHGGKISQRIATSSVRPAAPFITSIQAGYVKANDKGIFPTPRRMYKSFRTNEVSASKLPMSLAKAFVNYLRKYPYGCTEQVVSKGFPAVIFGGDKEFKSSKAKVARQVQGITEILVSRQLPDGGFAKWPGHANINAFHTAYAAHYLTEAKDRGYRIPKGLMDSVLSFLKEFSEREPENLAMARVQAYAAYLLTRNEIIATKALASLDKWVAGYKDKSWVKDVMLLYMAAAYKMMKATDKANQLLLKFDDASKMQTDYIYGVYDNTIKLSLHLYIVAKHFPEKIDYFNGDRLNILVKKLSSSYNSASSALAILAFEAYSKRVNPRSMKGVELTQVLDTKTEKLKLMGTLFPKSEFSPFTSKLNLTNTTSHPIYYSVTQSGFDNHPSKLALKKGLEVFREFLNEKGEAVTAAKIGQELTVRLRSRITRGSYAPNIATVDLLPGGFEVVIDSVDRENSRGQNVEYVDVREDRILLFGDFKDSVSTYTYRIKAINRGTYDVPPIFAESMYDRNLQTKGISSKIVVK